jgi:Ca-activated chloride channel homolog
MILLTDGANNAGDIPPQTAAKAAGELNIKIYAIGVGKEGQVPFPVEIVNPQTGKRTQRIQMMQSDINEKELSDIANLTGGAFFRAQNSESLKRIYDEIDKMEKTEIKSVSHVSYSEYFYKWLWIGFIILALEMLLQNTVFRRIP